MNHLASLVDHSIPLPPPRRKGPRRQKESDLTKKIIAALYAERKRGLMLFVYKVHGGPMQRPGVPDLFVCVAGRSVWFEIKTETGELSKIQEHTIDQMRKAGAEVFVVRSVDEVLEVIWSKNSSA